MQQRLSGRRAQAARNDEVILAAARAVFVADPEAPISAVAERAGVGISALYRRYASKEELLRTLCAEGLRRYNAEAEAAVHDDRDPWTAFADFMRRVVETDTNSLTLSLAGTFTPTPDMYQDASRSDQLTEQLVQRARATGVIRPDVGPHDLALVFEQIAAVRLGDEPRTHELRLRCLAIVLDGLRARPGGEPLPGQAPTWAEISQRWSRP